MDEKQRKAYDAKLSARRLHQQRKAGLDAKTKAHRDSMSKIEYSRHLLSLVLEERERTAKRQKTEHQAAQHDLDAEIRKLREEGLRKIEEENRRRQKEVEEMKKEQRKKECQIIVSCEDASDVPSEARLRSILQGYGNIVSLLQKGKLAIAEYDKPESAAKAISALNKHPVYNYSVKSSAGPEAMRKYDSVVQTATAHGYNTVTVGGHSADVQESRESMYQAHLDFERQILLQMGFDPDQQK